MDGFDGWGLGATGTFLLILQGIPIALFWFAIVTIVLFGQRKNPERQFRFRYFLLYSAGGILVGAIVGLLLIYLVTGQADDCAWSKTKIRNPSNYSAEQVAEAKRRSEMVKCPEVLENYKKVEGVLGFGVLIVSSIAPSVGLWAGYHLMPRRR
jgi:hypothetical protein